MPDLLVRELIAWGLDEEDSRPASPLLKYLLLRAKRTLSVRPSFLPRCPIVEEETEVLAPLLEERKPSIEASGEFRGLDWTLAVVDLRKLIAFQRRVCFASSFRSKISIGTGPADFLPLTLPAGREFMNESLQIDMAENRMAIRSYNPNLQLTFANQEALFSGASPVTISTGSPYFEVARFRDRWFLRDGYHRAYELLRQGVFLVPAVVLHTTSLEELGADKPWFFSESVLFSARPPLVADYQEESLVFEYQRPARQRVLRITLEESYEFSRAVDAPH